MKLGSKKKKGDGEVKDCGKNEDMTVKLIS